MYKAIIISLLMSSPAGAALTEILPVVKVFSLHKERQEKQIRDVVPLPTVLWHIIFSYRDAQPTEWTETSTIKDTSWFTAPCYSALIYLSSRRIAAASNNGYAEIFDPLTKKRVDRTETRWHDVFPDAVESLVHNKKNGEIIGGEREGSIRVWDDSSYKYLNALKGHKGCVKYLSLIRPNLLLSATYSEGNMRFWNTKEKQCVAIVPSHGNKLSGLAALNADSFVTVQDGYKVTLWDVSQQREVRKSMLQSLWPLEKVAVFDANLFASLCAYRVMFYDMRSMDSVGLYAHHKDNTYLRSLIVHHGLLISRSDGMIKIHDIRSSKEALQSIPVVEESDWSMEMASDPDSSSFAASIYPSAIKTWDL